MAVIDYRCEQVYSSSAAEWVEGEVTKTEEEEGVVTVKYVAQGSNRLKRVLAANREAVRVRGRRQQQQSSPCSPPPAPPGGTEEAAAAAAADRSAGPAAVITAGGRGQHTDSTACAAPPGTPMWSPAVAAASDAEDLREGGRQLLEPINIINPPLIRGHSQEEEEEEAAGTAAALARAPATLGLAGAQDAYEAAWTQARAELDQMLLRPGPGSPQPPAAAAAEAAAAEAAPTLPPPLRCPAQLGAQLAVSACLPACLPASGSTTSACRLPLLSVGRWSLAYLRTCCWWCGAGRAAAPTAGGGAGGGGGCGAT
jgi:hypothetical protein